MGGESIPGSPGGRKAVSVEATAKAGVRKGAAAMAAIKIVSGTVGGSTTGITREVRESAMSTHDRQRRR